MTDINREELGEWLSAYVDGELDDKERSLVAEILERDEEARSLLARLESTVGHVRDLPQHPAPDSILNDLRLQIERRELLGVEEDVVADRPSRDGWSVVSRWGLAAVLGFASIGGIWALTDGLVSPNRESPLAMGGLGESQLDAALNERREGDKAATDSRAVRRKGRRSMEAKDRDEMVAARPEAIDDEPAAMGKDSNVIALAPSDSAINVANLLNFEQKLASSVDKELLVDHRFDNERIRLSVAAPTPELQRQVHNAVLSRVSDYGLRDLQNDSGSAAVGGVFLAGREGVNYPSGSARQLLVRVPTTTLGTLYEDVESLTPAKGRVSFQLDSFRIEGKDRIETTIAGLSGQNGSMVSADGANRTVKPGEPTLGIFQDILSVINDQLPPEKKPELLAKADTRPTLDAEGAVDGVTGAVGTGADERATEEKKSSAPGKEVLVDATGSGKFEAPAATPPAASKVVKPTPSEGDNQDEASDAAEAESEISQEGPSLVERRLNAMKKSDMDAPAEAPAAGRYARTETSRKRSTSKGAAGLKRDYDSDTSPPPDFAAAVYSADAFAIQPDSVSYVTLIIEVSALDSSPNVKTKARPAKPTTPNKNGKHKRKDGKTPQKM
ncbi:MAG: anti-sigma factor family protein [Planctomycetota bacterium]|jgi:hypothetical protein